MSIRTRLLAGLLAVGIAFGVVATLAFRDLEGAREHAVAMRVDSFTPIAHLNAMKATADDAMNHSLVFMYEPDLRAGRIAMIVETDRMIGQELLALRTLELPPEIKANLEKVEYITAKLQVYANKYLGTDMQVLVPGAPEMTLVEGGEALRDRAEIIQASIAVMKQNELAQQQALADTYETARRNLIMSLAGAAAVAAAVAVVITRGIVRPVRRTVGVLESVAGGDLTPRLETGSDEIGHMADALNRTLDQIGGVIEAIDASANELAESSSGFTERSTELATAAARVAGDADAASTSVHLISSGVATVARTTATLGTALDEIATETAGAAGAVDQARAILTACTGAVGRLRDAASTAGAGSDGALATHSGRAASTIGELTRAIDELRGLQGRITASVEAQRTTTRKIGAAIGHVTSYGNEIDARLVDVAAAVSLTSQFLDETRTDAEHLAGLSQKLETLTAIFQYQRPELEVAGTDRAGARR